MRKVFRNVFSTIYNSYLIKSGNKFSKATRQLSFDSSSIWFRNISSTKSFSFSTEVPKYLLTNIHSTESKMGQESSRAIFEEEEKVFNKTYEKIVKNLVADDDSTPLKELYQWLEKVIHYNVPHGKRNRGLAVAYSFRILKSNQVDADELELARILGWCVEMLQAYLLVIDDFLDQSITRRGQLCWYRQDGVGLIAINDGLLLQASVFNLLKMHFKDKPYYNEILDLMLETNRLTVFGQALDLLSTPPGKKTNFNSFTLQRYDSIITYKTAFYSFVLPVRLAMYMAGYQDKAFHDSAEKILLKMGHFFQIQDDYLDCFGDSDVIGKIGTDIEDGKCTWLIVTALQRCNEQQKKLLLENYGVHNTEAVARVKQIYNELKLEELYHQYESLFYEEICQLIKESAESSKLPETIFLDFLSKIYKRYK